MTEELNGGCLDEREKVRQVASQLMQFADEYAKAAVDVNDGAYQDCDSERTALFDAILASLSTSKQAGAEPLVSREHDIALREGHQIRASEDYFCARSKDFHTINTVSAYEAGFKKGWEDRADLATPSAALDAREKEAGHDPLRELHDMLYMAQRVEGVQRDKAIGRARVIVHHLRDNARSCLTPEHLKGADAPASLNQETGGKKGGDRA